MAMVLNPQLKSLFLLFVLLLTACAERHAKPASVRDSVRLLARVPVGVSCQALGTVSARDGTGCANVGRNRVGREDILTYNLKQQARSRGANVLIIPDGFRHDSFEGCSDYGLVAEAELYTCDFSGAR